MSTGSQNTGAAPGGGGFPSSRAAPACLAALLALLYLPQLGTYGFIGPDEPRYARIAEEMALRGDWVVPTLRGEAWLEKPPLLYWLEMLSYRAFGVGEFAARFPSASLAVGLAVLLYFSLRGALGGSTALWAAWVMGSSGMFVVYAGAASTDMAFTAFLSAGMLGVRHAVELLSPAGAGASGSSVTRWWRPLPGTWWLWCACACFGLAVLSKGLLAFAIPTLAIFPYLFVTKTERTVFHWRLVGGALVLLLVAVPWHVMLYSREGFHFVLVYVINHHLARFFTNIHHHAQPFWYFAPILLAGLFPWTAFALLFRERRGLFRRAAEDPRSRTVLFCLAWLALPFAFLSLSKAKLPGYILPLWPPAAVLAALGVREFLRSERPARRVTWTVGLSAACLAVGIPWAGSAKFGLGWPAYLAGALVLPGAALFFLFVRRGRRELAAASLSLMILLPVWGAGPFLTPRVEPFFNQRTLSLKALAAAGRHLPVVVYRSFHHTNQYYLGYECTPNLRDIRELWDHVSKREPPVYVLTDGAGKDEILGRPGWRASVLASAGKTHLVELAGVPGSSP